MNDKPAKKETYKMPDWETFIQSRLGWGCLSSVYIFNSGRCIFEDDYNELKKLLDKTIEV